MVLADPLVIWTWDLDARKELELSVEQNTGDSYWIIWKYLWNVTTSVSLDRNIYFTWQLVFFGNPAEIL